MANILDRYGIKEVADVVFYEIDKETGNPSYPVLYLDTLKVSTIEQTAENAEARGGKGNAALISWDYNKEINVTLEDALFSAKSMAIMFGNGRVKNISGNAGVEGKKLIMKTEQFKATGSGTESQSGWQDKYEGPNGKMYDKINPKFYNSEGAETNSFTSGETYFCTFDLSIEGSVIEISASSFPGTYYITGDTYARSETSGDDEFFQFIIPKAKVTSENTITLEAEGDPSVFNLNLRVLRPADGKMMKLVKYELADELAETEAEAAATLIHNHNLVAGESNKAEAIPAVASQIGTTTNKTVSGAAQATSTNTEVATVTVTDSDENNVGIQTFNKEGTAVINVLDDKAKVLKTFIVTVA